MQSCWTEIWIRNDKWQKNKVIFFGLENKFWWLDQRKIKHQNKQHSIHYSKANQIDHIATNHLNDTFIAHF